MLSCHANALMIDENKGDHRVRVLLTELGLDFNLTDIGDFSVNVEFDDGRGQGVIIASPTYYVDRLEVREVLTVGFEFEAPLSADIGNALLIHNASVNLGAWMVNPHDDDIGGTAIFRCPVGAVTTAQSLYTVIIEVAKAGDFVEEKFTGKDEF